MLINLEAKFLREKLVLVPLKHRFICSLSLFIYYTIDSHNKRQLNSTILLFVSTKASTINLVPRADFSYCACTTTSTRSMKNLALGTRLVHKFPLNVRACAMRFLPVSLHTCKNLGYKWILNKRFLSRWHGFLYACFSLSYTTIQ